MKEAVRDKRFLVLLNY